MFMADRIIWKFQWERLCLIMNVLASELLQEQAPVP